MSNVNELINGKTSEEIKVAIGYQAKRYKGWTEGDIFRNALALIGCLETATAHSTWEIAIGYDPKRAYQCQNCFMMAYEPSNYCPNCGAKMNP